MSLPMVERMAEELSTRDQIQLIAHLSSRLAGHDLQIGEERTYKERMLAALALCDSIAEGIDGNFDSGADLEKLRSERISR